MASVRQPLGESEIRAALRAPREAEDRLFSRADAVRRRTVGDEVHLRGLIEIGNICRCNCLYCGLRAGHTGVRRYRMSTEEVLAAVSRARRLGYGTVVLQSAEDPAPDIAAVAGMVRRIKQEYGLAVTLSLGELPEADYARLREAGADRYLLKHETANEDLYRRLRPGRELSDRLQALATLRRLGFQIGGGCMVGLPGQTIEDLAADLRLLRDLDIDMAGIGPFIPCPSTPLWRDPGTWSEDRRVDVTYRMMALLRLCCPEAMIPVTTALQTLDPDAVRLGLQRGANVVMPNVGEIMRRRDYLIYPGKAGVDKTPETRHSELMALLVEIGRPPASGPGHRQRHKGC